MSRGTNDVFGVAPNATAEEIKREYKELSLSVHPDKCECDAADADAATTKLNLA